VLNKVAKQCYSEKTLHFPEFVLPFISQTDLFHKLVVFNGLLP
jgi:hypothetical protein